MTLGNHDRPMASCLGRITGERWTSYVATRNLFFEICQNQKVIQSQEESKANIKKLFEFTDRLDLSMTDFNLKSERLNRSQTSLEKKIKSIKKQVISP